jgi:hypothetical protein
MEKCIRFREDIGFYFCYVFGVMKVQMYEKLHRLFNIARDNSVFADIYREKRIQ